ncbi:MAG: hypothetical protein IJ809_04355 [Clostridia bacterium]|nr:hypothetical protein [Clostridia bacterium]
MKENKKRNKRSEKIKMMKKNITKILIIIAVITVCIGAKVYADYLMNASEVEYTKSDSSKVSVKAALDDLYKLAFERTSMSSNETYRLGQLVTYNNEEFYVLKDFGPTVELFAKTNLNLEATAQVNALYTTTLCAFSSSQYWKGHSVNLNILTGYTSTDVMGRVNTYVQNRGSISGRLLTYDEANALKDSYPAMLRGTGNTRQSYENYWLATTNNDSSSDITVYIYMRS